MFGIYKENKKLKEKIKLLEDEIDNLKKELYKVKGGNKLDPCKYCGGEVVYTGYEAHWIADIKCVDCGAKGFVNLMFM